MEISRSDIKKQALNASKVLETSNNFKAFQESLAKFKSIVFAIPIFVFGDSVDADTLNIQRTTVKALEFAVEYYATKASETEMADYASEHGLKSFDINSEVINTLVLLETFYFGGHKDLGKRKCEFIALHLLLHLVKQRFGDFYALLERLSKKERSDKQIEFVSSIEKMLMEGNYSQILSLTGPKSKTGSSRSALFTRWLSELEKTVQMEVASCIEKSYASITEKKAAELMTVKKGLLPETWNKNAGRIYFTSPAVDAKLELKEKISLQLIGEGLKTAQELERII